MSGRADTSDLTVRSASPAEKVMTVKDLQLGPSGPDQAFQAPLHGISFALGKREVLGIYGLLGAGRTELLEALAGNRTILSGTVLVNKRRLDLTSVSNAIRSGIVLVPEDRQRDGLVPELSIRENIALVAAGGILLSKKAETKRAKELVKDLNIAARDLELPVTALSGGNQQKVLIARCLMRKPSVLLLDEPTRGVDAGAKAEIYRILRKLASEGLSILFTSSEIEETKTLADRALVLRQGRISAEFDHHQLTDEALFAAASPTVTSGNAA
jgi:erythritol transport system ATP-binding protein